MLRGVSRRRVLLASRVPRRATGIATARRFSRLRFASSSRALARPGRGARARTRPSRAIGRTRATRAWCPVPRPPRSRGSGPVSDAAPSRSHRRRPPSSRLTERVFLIASSVARHPSSGAYKYVEELWKKKQSDVLRFLQRVRVWEYRQLPSVVRVTRPSRPDKARRLGYKAKQGFCICRARVRAGPQEAREQGHPLRQARAPGCEEAEIRAQPAIGRGGARRARPLRRAPRAQLVLAQRRFVYKYYEVIMVDPMHKVVRNDPRINWICNPVHKHREIRSLTAAGRKYRGLGGKGHNYNKARPSKRGTWKRNQKISLKRYR